MQCLVNEGVKVRALVRDYTKAVRQRLKLAHEPTALTPVSLQVMVPACTNNMCCLQSSDLYMNNVEVVKGDVYQYSTLPAAMKGW